MILGWIRNGIDIPFDSDFIQNHFISPILTEQEKTEMNLAIQKLFNLGAISVCNPSSDQYLSKIFLAPKPNGDSRFILNLKSLNNYVTKSHFKMEDHRTASKLITKHCFLATIDLKEAYLLVPVNINYRKYLRFQFENHESKLITYEFNAMPYGLSIAPRIFTKIMKEAIKYLRSQGFQSVIYLDDILCIGRDYNECINNVNATIHLLCQLGFIINYQKSCLEPTQKCKFLGFYFDTVNLTISLPEEKRKKIAQLVQKFSLLPTCTIRDFSQLIGVLVSACPAVKYGFLYTKTLERQKFIMLKNNNNNYNAKIKMPTCILNDLNWWKHNIFKQQNDLNTTKFQLEIFSDASKTGWGAFCNNTRACGAWKESEKLYHINYLELLAVYFALKSIAREMYNCAILLRIDNTTALSYINRMGGIQFPHLNNLSRQIWQWCEKRNIFLFASYINTKENIEADFESRRHQNPDTELELSNEAFQNIVIKFGQPEIDLFASRTNTKCKTYVSWHPDPNATCVDAFTISWENYNFYAFPPFPLILKCLQKIVQDKAEGILVFPKWPSQPWYPFLKTLVISQIFYFKPNESFFQLGFRNQPPHRLHQHLTLAAAIVSGRHS